MRNELETEQRLQHIDHQAPPAIAVRLFHSPWLLNQGPGGQASLLRAGSHRSIWNTDFKLWTPTAWLHVSPGLDHCFTPTKFHPLTVKVISWSLRPDAPVIYTGAFLIWQFGRIEHYHHLIILSRHQHGYPWPSFATPPYHSSLPVGLQGYTLYPHRAAVCRFELATLLFYSHVKGSIGVHHLWTHPYFSSSVLHVLFI